MWETAVIPEKNNKNIGLHTIKMVKNCQNYFIIYGGQYVQVKVRELPINDLHILLAFLPVFTCCDNRRIVVRHLLSRLENEQTFCVIYVDYFF